MNAAEDLVERVRRARKDRGWTQKQLADQAGVSLRTYQNFENRVGNLQGGNLRAILNAVQLETTDEDTAEETREGWAPDIRVILDTIGAYLATMTEAERAAWAHAEIRRIFENRATGR